MSIKWRLIALTAALVLVEMASFWKLSRWLSWTNETPLAYTSALAFIGLLLGSIIAMASSIPDGMRKQIIIGGLWLLLMQALANVLVAYQFGLSEMPVSVVMRFFSIDTETGLKSMAILQGATLSVVSVSFWAVIGRLLRDHWDARRRHQEELQKLERMMKGGSNG